MAVASGEILRGDDTDDFTTFRFYQQDFGVIVSKKSALHRLSDERPKFESLVRRLMVENKIELLDVAGLLDEEETAEKLLGDGERSLPNLRFADLRENPLQNVRHLKSVREIRLVGTVRKRL